MRFAILALLIGGAYSLFRAHEAGARELSYLDMPPESGYAPTVFDNIIEGVSVMVKGTRGERNNNPGNIRKTSTKWQGETDGADSAFETFATPEEGIRALAKLLRNYSRMGFDTIAEIITRFAPPSENNTEAYIASVSRYMGRDRNEVLNLSDDAMLAALTEAIINHENGGVRYTTAQIQMGVSLA